MPRANDMRRLSGDSIATQAVPILNADAIVLGGVTEFAKERPWPSPPSGHRLHCARDVHIHLVSAIANGLIWNSTLQL